ncbi:MAG: DUF692 domain-containing protein [Leptospirales bacterium]
MVTLEGISGCGVGLRREFLRSLQNSDFRPDWYEIVPENWISMPFEFRDYFEKVIEGIPLVAHGLSLSIGSVDPLNLNFLSEVKTFFELFNIKHYSEHLSFSAFSGGQTYELLPVPMTVAMANFIADKLKKAADFLGMPVIMENATYYHVPYAEMPESEFINLVLEKSGMPMLLDVNNVYVNSVNHGFDPKLFIKNLSLDRVAYLHVAGHSWFEQEEIYVDTHGKPVIDEVWELLKFTLNLVRAPVLLERDNNIPPLGEIEKEYALLKGITNTYYEP